MSYFSICIPQYNRTDFLIEACRSYAAQTFKDFEICISDDLSNDGKHDELQSFLASTGMSYVYRRNEKNLRYDGNLRSAIALSSGRYLLLMGNDDGLRSNTALAELHADLENAGSPAAAICNYYEIPSGRTYRRMSETAVLGSGPRLASQLFRSYSFVSGVILHGDLSRAASSTVVDGSEMYQMYLGTRLVAGGGRFLAIDRCCIAKDLQIKGQIVDSYRDRPRLYPCPIVRRPLPMVRLLEVVSAGLQPFVSPSELDRLRFQTAMDLYAYTYPFWGVEYRRIQSWRYALGVLLALNPSDIARGQRFSASSNLLLWPIYIASCAAGLLAPLSVFDRLQPILYRLAKRAT